MKSKDKSSIPSSASTNENKSTKCDLDDIGKCFKNKETISTEELKSMLESNARITLVDARSGKWDDGKRIAQAKNVTHEMADDQIKQTLGDKDQYIVTYCGSEKCPLSHKMANRLKSLGYQNVLVFPQGLEGWTSSGYLVN
jgi:rhodanese-related sulfurtransferase